MLHALDRAGLLVDRRRGVQPFLQRWVVGVAASGDVRFDSVRLALIDVVRAEVARVSPKRASGLPICGATASRFASVGSTSCLSLGLWMTCCYTTSIVSTSTAACAL